MSSPNRRVRQLAVLAEQFPVYFTHQFAKESVNAGIDPNAASSAEEAAQTEEEAAAAAAEQERQRRVIRGGTSLSGQAQIRSRPAHRSARQKGGSVQGG